MSGDTYASVFLPTTNYWTKISILLSEPSAETN